MKRIILALGLLLCGSAQAQINTPPSGFTAPTAPTGTNNEQIATTRFVKNALGAANLDAAHIIGVVPVLHGGTACSVPSGTCLDNITGFAAAGILARTGAGTYAFRSIIGTANEIGVVDGNQVSGNTVLSLPAALTFTGKTVTGGTFVSAALNGTLGATTPASAAVTTLSASGASTLAALSATTGNFSSTLSVSGSSTLAALSATTGSFSSTLAVSGVTTLSATLHIPNNVAIQARNAANSADINVAYLDPSDVFQIGGGDPVRIASTTASSSSTTGALQIVGGLYAGAQSLFGGNIGIGTITPATIGSGTGLAVGINGGISKIFVTPYVDSNLTTSALVVQVVDQAAASTNGGTGYEYAVVGGIKSTHSDGSLAPNKVGVAGMAELSGSTSGNGWGGYFLVSLDSGSRAGSIATGVEIDAINSTTTDRNYTNLGNPSYGLQVTGTSSKTNTAAILLSGAAAAPQWYAGIVFNNFRSTTADYGIDFAFDGSNTFGVTAMRLPNNQTIAWKQSGGTNANMLYLDGSDVFQIGGGLPVHIASTTASTTTTTGALTVAGGTGIVGALNVGGAVRADAGVGVNTAPNQLPGFSNTNVGIDLSNSSNVIAVSRASSAALFVNTNADGSLVSLSRSGTAVGSISVTTTATAYNTSSDRDRKEDERPYQEARRVIDDTQIWDFRWRATKERGVGVFAQDAYRVFPDAITPSDEPGGWQADYSKYVPVLIADAQETHRRLATLETQIHRLKGNPHADHPTGHRRAASRRHPRAGAIRAPAAQIHPVHGR